MSHEDFDAFWAGYVPAAREQVMIRGQQLDVPTDVPLHLQLRAERADVADEAEVRELVGELYGSDVLDRWVDAGMGARELSVVLAWSTARGAGQQLDFAAAAELVEQAMGKEPAPAPNRATRRATTKTTAPRSASSAGTGASSSPTSAASTRSRRTK